MENAKGTVIRYEDNVDTDVIIPARYLATSDPAELAKHCMEDIDPDFGKKIKKGDIIVAGKNFGCGSSREHAPIAIKRPAFPLSSRRHLRASSTAMRLISGFRLLNVRKHRKISRTGTRFRSISTPESSRMRPRAGRLKDRHSLRSCRRSSMTAVL